MKRQSNETHMPPAHQSLLLTGLLAAVAALGCLRPPPLHTSNAVSVASPSVTPPALEKMTEVDAWAAVPLMTPGTNIGNTLDNTTTWETGWGNPPVTKQFVESLAHLGFKTVRLPVAWDTYAVDGRIQPEKLSRVREIVDWITGAGMFCVLNIHWDGGWIDSDKKETFPRTFAGKNEKLIFEALNEETNFSNEGSEQKAYATLTRVNQLFIDTVRKTGGNNASRLLVVAGYSTDFKKTCARAYALPKDSIPGRMFISVHYYTPYTFCGLNEDADWGKMKPTWGTAADVTELEQLFDTMKGFCTRNDIPAFIGELGVTMTKESASRIRWLSAVMNASVSRRMVPVLWDTGGDLSRHEPYAASPELLQTLKNIVPAPAPEQEPAVSVPPPSPAVTPAGAP
jgi:endoglucanase